MSLRKLELSVIKSSETSYLGGDITVDKDGLYSYLFGGGYCEFKPYAAYADSIKYYYYTKDHLGNIRNVLTRNDSGTMEELQQTHYYPFGGIIADISTGRSVQNRLYNGKEQDFVNNLFWLDYGARQYDPTRGQFTTPDPLAEKYYPWNYYAYCVNNPVKFIDPDGRIVKIWYKDKNGKDAIFRFTGFHGRKSIRIPNNTFVKSVISAYVYNCQNGGGDKFKEAVYSEKTIFVDDARLYTGENEFENNGNQPTVYWNPEMGVKTTEGGSQSPATALEHEMDHATDYVRNPQQHNSRNNTYDAQYDTKEERRVITGSEAKTARANGECRRTDHAGTSYKTTSPNSTEEEKKRK